MVIISPGNAFQRLGIHLAGLLSLDLSFSSVHPENVVELILYLTNLQTLVLANCQSTNDNNTLIKLLPALTNLRELSIESHWNLNDHLLEQITETCPYLETLNISGCSSFTQRGLSVLSSLKQLQQVLAKNLQVPEKAFGCVTKERDVVLLVGPASSPKFNRVLP